LGWASRNVAADRRCRLAVFILTYANNCSVLLKNNGFNLPLLKVTGKLDEFVDRVSGSPSSSGIASSVLDVSSFSKSGISTFFKIFSTFVWRWLVLYKSQIVVRGYRSNAIFDILFVRSLVITIRTCFP
jgi:hypothetical protein